MSPSTIPFPNARILFFDLMGTLCNWHTSIISLLTTLPSPPTLPKNQLSDFALQWRAAFFQEIHSRFLAGEEQEDIDTTHRRTLDNLLEQNGVTMNSWDENIRETLVKEWHHQIAWPDVIKGLERLSKKYEICVLANGTTRLQLDIVRSAGLKMDMLFSSELLGITKPDLGVYSRAAGLVGVGVGECVMVAAHAYDLKAARGVGMGTVYIRRETEDLGEDFEGIEGGVGLFVDGRGGGGDCGLVALADVLCC